MKMIEGDQNKLLQLKIEVPGETAAEEETKTPECDLNQSVQLKKELFMDALTQNQLQQIKEEESYDIEFYEEHEFKYDISGYAKTASEERLAKEPVLTDLERVKGKKRKRCANFSEEEALQLLDLVNDNKKIIESKMTDNTTWKEKQAAWDKIAERFNAVSTKQYRSCKSLREKYDTMKKLLKKKLRATGSPQETPLTRLEETLFFSVPKTSGLISIHDSDQIPVDVVEKPIPEPAFKELSNEPGQSWASDKPDILPQPAQQSIRRTERRDMACDRISRVAAQQKSLLEVQKAVAYKELERVANLIVYEKLQHEKKMKILELKHKLLIEKMSE